MPTSSKTAIANKSVTFILITCFVFFFKGSMAVAQSSQTAIKVDVVYPELVQSNQTLVLTGTVEARQHANLAPLEAGRIATLSVEIGDKVTAGQQLLTLDSKLAKLEVQGAMANVNAAQVNLEEAERLYQEAKKLSKQQVVAQTLIAERAALLANTEAQLARANANLSLQQERLNRHRLSAPFNGVIAQRNVDIGEWVTQQTSALTLVAQDDLRLSIAIPEQYFSQLLGQPNVTINIVPDASKSQGFAANLSRLVPVSNATTRSFLAQIDLPNDKALVPGMSARADIAIPNTEQTTIILPRSAVKQHPDGGSSIFVAVNGKAKRIISTYTDVAGGFVSIDNQAADQAYIISGIELLQDGTPVIPNIVKSIR